MDFAANNNNDSEADTSHIHSSAKNDDDNGVFGRGEASGINDLAKARKQNDSFDAIVDGDGDIVFKVDECSPNAEAQFSLAPETSNQISVVESQKSAFLQPLPQAPLSDSPLKTDKKRAHEGNLQENASTGENNDDLPTFPLKKARTAYFIFADEKRDELKQLYKGEGVAAIARATGQLWSALEISQRQEYELKAAEERERVSKDAQRLKDAGLWPESSHVGGTGEIGHGKQDDDALILPIGRVRKICKLDPDVKGISKESTLLITKITELFCCKLGQECVTMAQMQNRRTLLPEDVVEVCSTKERFMFLRDDMKDLAREVLGEKREKKKESGKDGGMRLNDRRGAENTLDSYFRLVK